MADEERASRIAGDSNGQPASTLASLFLRAMRKHDRPAVLLHKEDSRWRETPDWRFERHVIRLALFLRDRAALVPAERAAIVSSLRPELAVAELAALSQGAASVVIDATLPADELAFALTAVSPAAVVLEKASMGERIGSGHRVVIALDGKPRDGWAWTEALDLGGTLDTPERAQSFRARAREVTVGAAALGYVVARDGAVQCQFIDQGEAVRRIDAVWADVPAVKGDVTYVAGPASVGARIAVLSSVSDGFTRCAIGTPGNEVAEVSELRPKRIVAPERLLESVRRAAPPATAENAQTWRIFEWLKGRRESMQRKG
jgi:hypothetical protein